MRRHFRESACRHGMLRPPGILFLGTIALFPTFPAEAGQPLEVLLRDKRIDPVLRMMDAASTSDVQLVIEGNVSRAALEGLGFSVDTQAGPVTTLRGSLTEVPGLLELPGIRLVSAATPLQPMLDVSAEATEATAVWGGSPPFYTGFTGENVVLGFVDTGLDINHADFRTPTNQTRIRYIWDQTWTGTKPPGFTYGAEYTEAQINAGTVTSFRDTDGHGTHVAGIAAGNGRATGNGQPDYNYIGMAPEADMVVVKTNFTDAGIIDGVNYIFQKAALLGKPAVVNLSVGTQKGGHDGSTNLDQALTALTGPGKLIAAAAGNFGGIPIHDRVDIPVGQTSTVVLTVPTYSPTTLAPENVFVEGWHDGTSTYRVKLRSPNGFESAWVEPGGTTGAITVSDGTYTVDNDRVTNSRGAKLIQVIAYRASTTSPHPAMGNWTVTLQKTGGSNPTADFWVSAWKLGTVTSPSFVGADMSCLITSPGTADGVITTGAYATKNQWTNGNGGTSSYGNVPLQTIADFSSPGPRRDGAQKPDIVAPGYGIAAALSVNAPTSNTWKCLDLVHYMRIGTSASSAHTAGALALLLQGNPLLTPAEARQELIQRARTDSYTGAVPNSQYGHGKLDVAVASSAVTELVPPAAYHFSGPWPNPSVRTAAFSFRVDLDETPAGTPVALGIFDVQGRMVAEINPELSAGESEVVWDGRMGNGEEAPAGVYFARLRVGSKATGALRVNRVK